MRRRHAKTQGEDARRRRKAKTQGEDARRRRKAKTQGEDAGRRRKAKTQGEDARRRRKAKTQGEEARRRRKAKTQCEDSRRRRKLPSDDDDDDYTGDEYSLPGAIVVIQYGVSSSFNVTPYNRHKSRIISLSFIVSLKLSVHRSSPHATRLTSDNSLSLSLPHLCLTAVTSLLYHSVISVTSRPLQS